jgi:tetratricopeptide (TPR) repeat protein
VPASADKIQLTDTLALLTQEIRSDSLNGDLYNQRARFYLRKGEFNLAMHDINKALTIKGDDFTCLITLSDIYLNMGKVDYARETLNKAADINPLDPTPILKLADLYLILKNYTLCHEYANKVVSLDQNSAQAYFIDGYAWLESGDTAKAIRDFQMSVHKDQAFFNGYAILGSLFTSKNNRLAAEYYRNASALRPDDKDMLYNLALCYQNDSLYNEAEKTYLSILAIDSSNFKANYNVGYINLIHREDYTAAILYFTKAISGDPNYADAYYNRGLCYEIINDYENARSDYQNVLGIRINYPKAIEGLNRLDKKIKK